MIQERTDDATKLALMTSISAVTTTSLKDQTDQKTFVEQRYDVETSLGNFMDNLKAELLVRPSWDTILYIPAANGKFLNILE